MTQREDAAVMVVHNSMDADAAAALLARADRPTLMGLAPLEASDADVPAAADAAPVERSEPEQARGHTETSTVRPMCFLASDAALEEPQLNAAVEPERESPAEAVAETAPHEVPAAKDASADRDAHPVARDESDPEWQDLSTRWLVATGPEASGDEHDNEVTEHFQWSERLAAHAFARAHTRGSVAPAPPQPLPAAAPPRHVTLAFGRASEAPAARPSSQATLGAQAAFGAHKQWAPSGARHATLAGISPLAEDRSHWPVAQDAYALPPLAAQMPLGANDAAWQAGTTPRAPATWGGPASTALGTSPPWAASSGFGAPAPHAAYGYTPDERRSSRPTGYPAYYAAPSGGAGARRFRAPRQPARGASLEPWKGLADTWLATLFKCAVALMLLHYSGMAVPLLALFGYAPAAPASASARSEAALQPAVPVAATLAASSVVSERVHPALEEDSAQAAAARRVTEKRELSSSYETTTRRHSARAAHKQKLAAAAQPQRAPEPVARAAAAAAAVQPQPQSQPQPVASLPPVAASDDAAGEAFLRINSRPWSQVFIDGTHVGHTPKLDLRVSAGAHRIRLVNPELGVTKTIELRAAAGETVSHVEFMEE